MGIIVSNSVNNLRAICVRFGFGGFGVVNRWDIWVNGLNE